MDEDATLEHLLRGRITMRVLVKSHIVGGAIRRSISAAMGRDSFILRIGKAEEACEIIFVVSHADRLSSIALVVVVLGKSSKVGDVHGCFRAAISFDANVIHPLDKPIRIAIEVYQGRRIRLSAIFVVVCSQNEAFLFRIISILRKEDGFLDDGFCKACNAKRATHLLPVS